MPSRKFQQLKDKLETYNNEPPIVVVGSGPAGASAALGAAKKGYKVVVVTNYPYVVRSQRVKLDSDKRQFLEQFRDPHDPEDEKFFKKLDENQFQLKPKIGGLKFKKIKIPISYTVSIGSVERFLLRKLKKNQNIELLDARDAAIDQVDLENANIKLNAKQNNEAESDSITLPFHHLIDASGAKSRVVFTKANAEMVTPDQHPHEAQGTAIFHLKNKEKYFAKDALKRTIFRLKFSEDDLKFMHDHFRWKEPYPPSVYIISDARRNKFYVGGEIPNSILEITDKNIQRTKVKEWCQFMLAHQFKIVAEDLFIKGETIEGKIDSSAQNERTKSYLKKIFNKSEQEATPEEISLATKAANLKTEMNVTAFKMETKQIKDPVREINGHVVVALGDTLQNPNFHKAHGLNDALKGANEFNYHLPEKGSKQKFNFKPFQKFIHKMQETHSKRMHSVKLEYDKKEEKGFVNLRKVESKSKKTETPSQGKPIETSVASPHDNKQKEKINISKPEIPQMMASLVDELQLLLKLFQEVIQNLQKALKELNQITKFGLFAQKPAANDKSFVKETVEEKATLKVNGK